MKRKPPAISGGVATSVNKMVLVRDAAQNGGAAETDTYDLQAVAMAGSSPRRHASTSVNKSQAAIESGGN